MAHESLHRGNTKETQLGTFDAPQVRLYSSAERTGTTTVCCVFDCAVLSKAEYICATSSINSQEYQHDRTQPQKKNRLSIAYAAYLQISTTVSSHEQPHRAQNSRIWSVPDAASTCHTILVLLYIGSTV